jgi:hypothetical protein
MTEAQPQAFSSPYEASSILQNVSKSNGITFKASEDTHCPRVGQPYWGPFASLESSSVNAVFTWHKLFADL